MFDFYVTFHTFSETELRIYQ